MKNLIYLFLLCSCFLALGCTSINRGDNLVVSRIEKEYSVYSSNYDMAYYWLKTTNGNEIVVIDTLYKWQVGDVITLYKF